MATEPTIEAYLLEERTFPPPDSFVQQALIKDRALYEEAERDWEGFWAKQTRELLTWFDEPKKTLEWDLPFARWFEGGTLNVYNWDAYMYKKTLKAFEDQFGVTVEWTTFNNMEEGIQKLVAGSVEADVFFPTTDYVARLVEADILQVEEEAEQFGGAGLIAFLLTHRLFN